MALAGRSVAVVDADIGLRNLDVVLGLESRIVHDLVQVVERDCTLREALVRDPRVEGLHLLPAAQTRDKSAVGPRDMVRLVQELKEQHEYVVIDCPAGIGQGFRTSIAAADRAIVVTTPEIAAIRDADRIVGLLHAHGLPDPHLLVNRYRPGMVLRGEMMTRDDILEILRVPLIGIVPDHPEIITSTNRGHPVVFDERSLVGQAFRRITDRVMGFDVPVPDLHDEPTLWDTVRRWMGWPFARAAL